MLLSRYKQYHYGVGTLEGNDGGLLAIGPCNSRVMQNAPVELTWRPARGQINYEVSLYRLGANAKRTIDLQSSVRCNQPVCRLPLSKPVSLQPGELYWWRIGIPGRSSAQYSWFEVISVGEQKSVDTAHARIRKLLPAQQRAWLAELYVSYALHHQAIETLRAGTPTAQEKQVLCSLACVVQPLEPAQLAGFSCTCP
jgi:hypothetical protein